MTITSVIRNIDKSAHGYKKTLEESGMGGKNPTFFDIHITMKEFLKLLDGRYSRSTIDRWRQKGLPCRRLNGGKLWFPKESALQWVERNCQ